MAYELSPINLKTIHVKTTEQLLGSYPITNGAIYLCTDSGNLYYDLDNERKIILSQTIEKTNFNTRDINNIKVELDDYLSWYTYTE